MILVSGEALIDLIPDPVKPGAYDVALGGSPYNVAIGLARLGAADGVRLAHFGGRQRRGARQFVGRKRRRSEFRRARRAPDHARLRHARHRQDRFALFVLPRCDRLRRPVALSGRVAQRRPPPACRLDRGGRPPPWTIRRPRADGSAPQRNRQLRSQHPTSCDAGSRLGEAPRRAASLARTSGQGQPGRPRVALSRPRASRTASPPGRSPARDFA